MRTTIGACLFEASHMPHHCCRHLTCCLGVQAGGMSAAQRASHCMTATASLMTLHASYTAAVAAATEAAAGATAAATRVAAMASCIRCAAHN